MLNLKSLYTRLALGLVLLLFVIGILYAALNTLATKKFIDELDQDLHRSLAKNLVADKNLVEQGKLNEDALKKTFEQYMVVNPSIEIYLLDLEGKLLSFSADPNTVMRSHVNLDPIKAYLNGDEKYPLGDDPRSHEKQKAFSVTGVPSNEAPEGYLYVVLRGEQYDAIESMAFEGFWKKTGLWSMLLSLGIGLLAGLAIFYGLTKRLRRVSRQMEDFSASDFSEWQFAPTEGDQVDEIGQIEQTFSDMAERIQTQLSALSDKDSQRRQLIAQVSHDLRTPLASMLGYIESLRLKQDDIAAEDMNKYLDIAYKQGRRLSDMIESLFQLSSLEAKEIQPKFEPFMPLELLFDVRQKYALRAAEHGLTIAVLGDKSNAFALGDISLFERVLDNLIDNAMGHAAPQSVIEMRLEEQSDIVSLSIENRGDQIDAESLKLIFDPFFRAKSQNADKRHAGLGLAISTRIMESLKGTLSVKNTDDGVTFTASLPRYKH